ncbi:hypothetical protein EDC04DRAFT_2729978 [Pisolithus marmoratus]|nr:hypothetical protein EDC04DRAFT_2729978 [Pisolithus marmoratus]
MIAEGRWTWKVHHIAGTKARYKSVDRQKTSGVVDFSAMFCLNYLKTFVGEITFFERLPLVMESQLCNEPGETSVRTAQGQCVAPTLKDPRCTHLLLERCEGLVRRPYDRPREIHNEVKFISQTLGVALLDRIHSSFLEEPEDKERTGHGARTDYDPVGTILDIH